MSAALAKGEWYFECDDCAELLETEEREFQSAWELLKEQGWRAIKVGPVWEHRCPSCQEERA